MCFTAKTRFDKFPRTNANLGLFVIKGVGGVCSRRLRADSVRCSSSGSEAQGGAAEVAEAPVDRLRGTVAGAGPVEEREHVDGALLQCPAELAQFDKSGRDAACGGSR